jgi:hypothetical protein
MFMAIAAETPKHPSKRNDYKVWYLEVDERGDVIGIGVKSREELVQSLFENYRQTGKSHWRAFRRDADRSNTIEVFDFMAQGMNDNTHFGNLPTLAEFQDTLSNLQMSLELRAIAS